MGNKVIRMRKFSHLAARRQVAMGIYKAPVVSNRYRKVVNHFNNKAKSTVNDGKFATSDPTLNPNSSINLQITTSAALALQPKPDQTTQPEPISTKQGHIEEQE